MCISCLIPSITNTGAGLIISNLDTDISFCSVCVCYQSVIIGSPGILTRCYCIRSVRACHHTVVRIPSVTDHCCPFVLTDGASLQRVEHLKSALFICVHIFFYLEFPFQLLAVIGSFLSKRELNSIHMKVRICGQRDVLLIAASYPAERFIHSDCGSCRGLFGVWIGRRTRICTAGRGDRKDCLADLLHLALIFGLIHQIKLIDLQTGSKELFIRLQGSVCVCCLIIRNHHILPVSSDGPFQVDPSKSCLQRRTDSCAHYLSRIFRIKVCICRLFKYQIIQMCRFFRCGRQQIVVLDICFRADLRDTGCGGDLLQDWGRTLYGLCLT